MLKDKYENGQNYEWCKISKQRKFEPSNSRIASIIISNTFSK